ncbi:hypothetical protein ACFTY7_06655 [Streptomyces sp. NPDC057062]|uniref:hypothetical protein n=1 Tax=Streptomyces sp. NPDC057062 TaxID=3346011 RepID=UPI00363D8D60
MIRGLAEACQAVQGQGGSWDTAAADYAAVQGRLTSCKGRAAYAVLGGVLQFHRQHPSITRKLKASTSVGDADACDFQIVSVDVGGDGEAQPCDTLTIKLAGIYFSKTELLDGSGYSSVTVAGVEVYFEGERDYDAEPPDQLTFNVVVPHAESGTYPQSVDVTVEYGDRATLKDAFTLVAPDPGSAPGPSPDDCPATSQESASTGTASSR